MLVSVVMPVYNGANYIRCAIEGVLRQTFEDFELLIIDDVSKDGTPRIVREFSDPRIRLVQNKTNLGSFGNGNRSFDLAKGKYVFTNHHDDVMMPRALEKAVGICEGDEEISCVGLNAIRIDAEGKEHGPYFTHTDKDILFTTETFLDAYFRQYTMAISSVLIRKSVLEAHKIRFDRKAGRCADMALWIKLALGSRYLYFVREPLFYRRIHPEQSVTGFFTTAEHWEEYILKTDFVIFSLLAGSSLAAERKAVYIQQVLNHMYQISLSLSARHRERVLLKLRKKLEPVLAKLGLQLARTVLKVYPDPRQVTCNVS